MAVEQEPPELGPLRDSSVLWRVSLWGGAAAVALAAAVLMTQTDIGAQRLQMVFTGEPEAPPVTQPITQADFVPRDEADALKRETLRLEAQVRQLAADREKLNARIATLETSLSDVTGSIKRELAAVAAKPAPAPPVVSAPPTTPPPARLEPIPPPEAKLEQKIEPKVEPAPTPPAPAAALLPPPQPQTAPPLSEPVPLPPMRVASTSPGDIGIDLGGARTLEIMQARWIAVKANFGPLLTGLQPLVAHDARPNMIPYRLVVGPLPNAASAAQVCARFAASKVTCRSTKYAGEPLAPIQ